MAPSFSATPEVLPNSSASQAPHLCISSCSLANVSNVSDDLGPSGILSYVLYAWVHGIIIL